MLLVSAVPSICAQPSSCNVGEGNSVVRMEMKGFFFQAQIRVVTALCHSSLWSHCSEDRALFYKLVTIFMDGSAVD